ncbi:MAG: hypothetical protein ACI8RZ_002033 [Myxococcota bacterium]|jgi:hypothetical protein
MSSIDELIARSRSPGTFIERREFTLSREKALEKLREFSLRNPRQYILELIQAAVFSGATYVAVDINKERLLVAWVGGQPYTATELEQIMDYIFADRGEMSTRHLTQLAIGLNALLKRNPKLIRIESGDGSPRGTARMDLNPSGEGSLGLPEDGLAGTYILVEYAKSWIPSFSRRQFHDEEGVIETRCLYVPVPILLNGRAPFGYRASRDIHIYGIRHQQTFDDGGRRGVVGIPGRGAAGGRSGDIHREFRMIVGGVWISSLELPELGGAPGADGAPSMLAGVICDDRLRKTADQSDIVQDRRYIEMLHAVQPVATELIRNSGTPRYTPPMLPAVPSGGVEEEADTAEPLPEIIPQLAPRGAMDVEALKGLGEGAPIFWTRPEDIDGLAESVDPLRFPWPVLVLSEGQAKTLEVAAAGLGVARLGGPADADFVRRVLERRQLTRTISIPFRGANDRGMLRIRYHAAGATPTWSDPRVGRVPVLIATDNKTLWCGQAPIALERISIVLELEAPPTDRMVVRGEIIDLILPHAWRLLEEGAREGDAEPDIGAERDLLAGVLASNSYAHFVEEDGALALSASLPSRWGDAAARLRGQVLCDTVEGPLSFTDFLDLQGSAQLRTLTSTAQRVRMEPLEERFGFGHLRLPTADQTPVLAVGRVGNRWRRISAERLDNPTMTHLLWVRASFSPDSPLPSWVDQPSGMRSVGQVCASEAHLREGRFWETGLRQLLKELLNFDSAGTWSAMASASGHSAHRCCRMSQLALLELVWMLDEADRHRILPVADSSRALAGSLKLDTFRIAPFHGPATVDDSTALLTYDQVSILSERGVPLRPRLDDRPELWASLEDPDDAGWLIRQEVRIPGLKGWLGLRAPFDGTSGILIQSLGAMVAMPSGEAAAPCHGLLWLSGGASQPTEVQLELIRLARKQLYQQLAEQVGLTSEMQSATDAYLTAYAAEQAPTGVYVPASSPLLSFQERLLSALTGPGAPSMHLEVVQVEKRSGRTAVQLSVDNQGLLLALNTTNTITAEALARPQGEVAELLLLEMARRICLWGVDNERELDLLEMQRVLIAQRLSQVGGPRRPGLAGRLGRAGGAGRSFESADGGE